MLKCRNRAGGREARWNQSHPGHGGGARRDEHPDFGHEARDRERLGGSGLPASVGAGDHHAAAAARDGYLNGHNGRGVRWAVALLGRVDVFVRRMVRLSESHRKSHL